MFGNGNWSVYKVNPTERDAFVAAISNENIMLSLSAFNARTLTSQTQETSYGINPFREPRQDDKYIKLNAEIAAAHAAELFAAASDPDMDQRSARISELLAGSEHIQVAFGHGESAFKIHEAVDFYALWFVENTWKDVQDSKSRMEQYAYDKLSKPFKFIDSKQKQAITADVVSTSVLSRKQAPVLIDLVDGLVYVENTNKTFLQAVIETLSTLGLNSIPTAWQFGDSQWAQTFLDKVREETRFRTEIKAYAEARKNFTGMEEDETIEDRETKKIVTRFFAISEAPNEVWVGLGTPAKVRLHPSTDAIGIAGPELATILLATTDTSTITSSVITLQETLTKFSKKTQSEYIQRNDILRIDISDEMNNVDVGVALLPSFDLPQFGKTIKKDRTVLEVPMYWYRWLMALRDGVRYFVGTVAEVLELRVAACGLTAIYADESESEGGSGLLDDLATTLKKNGATITVEFND